MKKAQIGCSLMTQLVGKEKKHKTDETVHLYSTFIQ